MIGEAGLEPPLTQVAFSVVDLAATERWFREGLGFWPAGGSRRMMRGPLASSVQGLPRVASTCWWMVDRNEFFQLEMFQFERPLARLMAHDFRPCDIGYARIGVWVADFDQTLTRLARLGSPPLSDPIGPAGCASRVRAQSRRGVRRDHGGRPARRRWTRPEQIGLPGRGALGHALGSRPRPVRSVLRSRTRPAALRCRAASARARGAVGAGRRTDAQQRVHRRQRPRRARAVSRSDRAAAPGGLPDLRSRHPQHRLRRSEQARSRRALPSGTRSRGAGEPQAASHCPARASSTSTTRTSSRSSCCGCPGLGRALGIHAATGGQAATGRHARGRADGADRRARAGHVGCDRRPRDTCPSGSVSALSAGPSTVHRIPTVAAPNGC